MAKTLFISVEDIKTFSSINGNVDDNKIIQFISIAQDLDLEVVLGTRLFNRVITEIESGTISTPIQLLLDKYIKPTLIHYANARILPSIAYTIANGGIFKHSSENSETVSIDELNLLTEQSSSIAGQYADRMAKFLNYHNSDYPEYTNNTNEEIRPDRDPIYSPFELNGSTENARMIKGFYHRNK